MRLIDCFAGLMAYSSYAVSEAERQNIPYDRLRKDVEALLLKADETAVKAGFNEDDYQSARFAVLAWVDETVLCSNWEGRRQWEHNQLQRSGYKTTSAGEEFFKWLERVDPDNRDVLEVYAHCLAMGFAGRYYSVRSIPELEELADKYVKMVNEGVEDPFKEEEGKFFPKAYIDKDAKGGRKWSLSSISKGLLLALIAAAIVIGCYYSMDSYLNNLVDAYFKTGG